MDNEQAQKLIKDAIKARSFAYAPYSNFSVGAALLAKSGKIYVGCNVESAAYTPTCCAERIAFFKAVSEGERDFVAIAVVGSSVGKEIQKICPPCGVCRQVMAEFCDPDKFEVILGESLEKIKKFKLKDLFPLNFNAENLI